MSNTNLKLAVLIAALVTSNLWWAYRVLDAGVSVTYREAVNEQALAQALALLPAVARPDATRSEVEDAARAAAPSSDPFEANGFVWVGKIGLKFNKQGRLVEARRAWDPP